MVSVAVASPPAGVHRKLHEVGNAKFAARSRGLAALECAERLQADRGSALGFEVSVQKMLVGKFVVSIVVNVLRHVGILLGNGVRVSRIAATAGNFVGIRNAAQLVVLHPKVGFDDFGGRRKTEECRIPRREPTAFFVFCGCRSAMGQESGAHSCYSGGDSFLEEAAACRGRVSRSCWHGRSPSRTRAFAGPE